MSRPNRVVVNVATGPHYLKGQERLLAKVKELREQICAFGGILEAWPSHDVKPYAFKAYALAYASRFDDTLLWCDASLLPIKPLGPLWERIERDGYWISRNGFTNYEWTADSAYPDLFSDMRIGDGGTWTNWGAVPLMIKARLINREIEHVTAGCFGISLRHETGREILRQYLDLAKTNAFCGPWINAKFVNPDGSRTAGPHVAPCGPSDVRGHRHDQTALSVIGWRLGLTYTSAPEIIAYRGGETESTILVFDGAY